MPTPKDVAQQIMVNYRKANVAVKKQISDSPEPLRSMIYLLGDVDGESIDGTDEYCMIVDELEKIY